MNTIANAVLPTAVKPPSYDRTSLKTRIVHLGFGAFHRAHQGLYTHDVAQCSPSDWGICEVNLFSGDAPISQLKQQNFLHSVLEKKAEQGITYTEAKIIGTVTEALHPKLDSIDAIIDKMAEPQVAIISLTITEKGYCCDPSTGQLDQANELIKHDLENPTQPKSAIGYIVQALLRRYQRGLPPLSILSCDNVQNNGHAARAAVTSFAHLLDEKLAQWIEDNITFPCTMVDRIVPAMTDESFQALTSELTVEDPVGIVCEPFRQWVIEDNFTKDSTGASCRPNWNLVGAQFVDDVAPFEEMKLRMLNGSHSFLAYLGYLGGYKHVADAVENQNYRQAIANLMMQEQAPTLSLPAGTDIQAYADSLLVRFSNSALRHQTWQIAMDGSQKLPQRMLNSIRVHLERGTNFSYLALGVAGWMRYVSGIDEQGQTIDIRDPMAAELKEVHANYQGADLVQALLGIKSIFGDLIHNQHAVASISKAYLLLTEKGARATLASL